MLGDFTIGAIVIVTLPVWLPLLILVLCGGTAIYWVGALGKEVREDLNQLLGR